MDKLIEKLEAATEGSKELDRLINWPDTITVLADDYEHPHYTTSIDAALTLVPEGWVYSAEENFPPRPHCWRLDKWDGDRMEARTEGIAPTPALALCIAALKARQHE